ncbi:MAG TPA: hypothetical protein VM938_09780 [Acidimicrobiales bacterium]|nr:hypothetical protein [Acidimicrobiales bacterium]
MARIRRIAAVLGVAALAGAVATGPAQADSPEVFSGSAAGSALDLSVLGKQATFGVSAAQANSTGAAKARGIGQATTTVAAIDSVVGTYGSDKTATATAGTSETKAKSCQPADLAEELPDFINVGLVCSAAAASGKDGAPSASAEGSVAEASLDAELVVQQLPVDTGVIGGTLAGVLDPVCATLATACPATTTVKDLVESVLKTQTLDIALGKSTSSVTTAAGTVTSNATAAGAVIKILPLPQVDGLPATEPVVTITIGEATATAVYDRTTGKATPTVDPALVRIEFNTTLTDSLDLTEIVLKPTDLLKLNDIIGSLPAQSKPVVNVCDDGRAVCILENTPLESRIYLATGSAKVNEDGSATAVADAVRVDLLMGLTELLGGESDSPGVRLALAHAEAGVGGKPAQVDEVPEELPRGDAPVELPRTGGLPMVPFLGAGLLSLAVVLRRATAKATR